MNEMLNAILRDTMRPTKKNKYRLWCPSAAYWTALKAVCWCETHDIGRANEEARKLDQQLRMRGFVYFHKTEDGTWLAFMDLGADLLGTKFYLQDEREEEEPR